MQVMPSRKLVLIMHKSWSPKIKLHTYDGAGNHYVTNKNRVDWNLWEILVMLNSVTVYKI